MVLIAVWIWSQNKYVNYDLQHLGSLHTSGVSTADTCLAGHRWRRFLSFFLPIPHQATSFFCTPYPHLSRVSPRPIRSVSHLGNVSPIFSTRKHTFLPCSCITSGYKVCQMLNDVSFGSLFCRGSPVFFFTQYNVSSKAFQSAFSEIFNHGLFKKYFSAFENWQFPRLPHPRGIQVQPT